MGAPSLSRRAFLRGAPPAAPPPLRPPWALDEPAFLSACTTCGDCVAACPEAVLVAAADGRPVFDPGQGECTFCEACVTACEPHALDLSRVAPAWRLKAAIASTCLALNGVTCLSCRDACGETAIRFRPALGGARPELDPERCTGCGACVSPCPVSAIALAAPLDEARPHG